MHIELAKGSGRLSFEAKHPTSGETFESSMQLKLTLEKVFEK